MKNQSVAPFLSVGIILATLLIIVGLRTEERRMGYQVLQQTHNYQKSVDQNRMLKMNLAQLTSPNILKRVAVSQLTMGSASQGQVIFLSGRGLAVAQ